MAAVGLGAVESRTQDQFQLNGSVARHGSLARRLALMAGGGLREAAQLPSADLMSPAMLPFAKQAGDALGIIASGTVKAQAFSFLISSASIHSARFSETVRSMLATGRVCMRRP